MKPVFDQGSQHDYDKGIPEYKTKDEDPKAKDKSQKKRSAR